MSKHSLINTDCDRSHRREEDRAMIATNCNAPKKASGRSRSTSIVELQEMNRTALLALWLDVFEQPAPRMLSQSFLRRFLAFELLGDGPDAGVGGIETAGQGQ